MKHFKITKSYQGGEGIYFASMPSKCIITKDTWQSQLEEWGERTNGGHNYGYHIDATPIKKLPKGEKKFLSFNVYYLKGLSDKEIKAYEIREEQKQVKRHKELLARLKKGL